MHRRWPGAYGPGMTTHTSFANVENQDPGRVAMCQYEPRCLTKKQWASWRDDVASAVSAAVAHNAEMARGLAGDLCELIAVSQPEPGTPMTDLVSDAAINSLAHRRRQRGVGPRGIARGTTALLRLQRIVRGFDSPSPAPVREPTAHWRQMAALHDMCQSSDAYLAACAKALLWSLRRPEPEPWANPLNRGAFDWFVLAATRAGYTACSWRWIDMKTAAVRAQCATPRPAAAVIKELGLSHGRLDRTLSGTARDVPAVGSRLRGSGRSVTRTRWEIVTRPMTAPDARQRTSATKRISAAEARRRRAEILNAHRQEPQALPDNLEAVLQLWAPSPNVLSPEDWDQSRALTLSILRRSHIRGETSMLKHLRLTGRFVAWTRRAGYDPEIDAILRGDVIDESLRNALVDAPASTRATVRANLRRLATTVSLSPEAPAPRLSIGHWDVKAPYVASEVAWIWRQIELERDDRQRRRLQTTVSLGLGAGLDTRDIKEMTRSHINDLGEEGIRVDVPGDRPRQVWLRRDYEPMLRSGISRLTKNEHVLGRQNMHKDAVTDLYGRIQPVGKGPRIQQGRLRNTWIATLMTEPIALRTVLAAAGLSGARTLTDLARFIEPVSGDQSLRGAA